MFDAHDAGAARRVDELVAADSNRHMRRTRIGGREEDHVAGDEIAGLHRLSNPELIADLARQRHAVLREDVLREAAAIESAARIGSAVAVWDAAQRQRSADERIAVERRWPRGGG